MTKVLRISSDEKFKEENLNNWKEVSEFWLTGNISQKKDLKQFYSLKIGQLIKGKSIKILDVGFGDGWILDILESLEYVDYTYVGIDYNKTFVTYLRNNVVNTKASFKYFDIENEDGYNKLGLFDLIINSFSLFEMPNYNIALKNESKLLAPKGSLLVFSIDPISQLMAISNNENEFKENCLQYTLFKNQGYYRKLIDTGEGFADQEYLGILHSISDYLKELKQYNFTIVDLDEINLLQDVVPKVYQYAEFKRKN